MPFEFPNTPEWNQLKNDRKLRIKTLFNLIDLFEGSSEDRYFSASGVWILRNEKGYHLSMSERIAKSGVRTHLILKIKDGKRLFGCAVELQLEVIRRLREHFILNELSEL